MKFKIIIAFLSFLIVLPTFGMEFIGMDIPLPSENPSAPENNPVSQQAEQILDAIQSHPTLKIVIDGKEIDSSKLSSLMKKISNMQINNGRVTGFDEVLRTALEQESTRNYMLNSLFPNTEEETAIINHLKDRAFDKHENYFKKQRLNFFQRHYLSCALFTGIFCFFGKDYIKNWFTK